MSSEELKPCPFCGSRPEVETKNKFLPVIHRIICKNLRCRVRPSSCWGQNLPLKIRDWNKRN